MGSTPTKPDPCGLGLNLCNELGWVEKSPQPDPTQPMQTLRNEYTKVV